MSIQKKYGDANIAVEIVKNDSCYNLTNTFNTKNIQLQTIRVINIIHQDFSKTLSKNLSKLFNFTINIQYLSSTINLFEAHCKKQFDTINKNMFKINNVKNILYINIPKRLINLIVHNLFSNTNLIYYDSNIINKSIMKKYVNDNLFSQIIKIYKKIWSKIYIINLKHVSFKERLNITKSNSILNDLFFNFSFKFTINNKNEIFNIYLSFNIMKNVRKKILNQYLLNLNNNVRSNTSNKNLLNIFNNLQVNLVVQLKTIKISLLKLFKIKVGDILLIESPDNVIVNINKKTIIHGKCTTCNQKYAVRILNIMN